MHTRSLITLATLALGGAACGNSGTLSLGQASATAAASGAASGSSAGGARSTTASNSSAGAATGNTAGAGTGGSLGGTSGTTGIAIAYTSPAAGMGDKPYFDVGPMGGNGQSLTWDGRLSILSTDLSPVAQPAPDAGPLATYSAGEKLATGQSLTAGGLTLTMQSDCNLVLTNAASTVLFASNTSGACTAPDVVLQGDGNLVIYGIVGSATSASAIWASNSSGNAGATLVLYADAPYIAVMSAGEPTAGELLWTPNRPGAVPGWAARLFLPEALGNSPPASLGAIETAMQGPVFSDQFPWALPPITSTDAGVDGADFASTTEVLTGVVALNSLALAPAPGYPENPYYSDVNGNLVTTGSAQYMTYQLTVLSPTNTADTQLTTFTATAIVENPHSAQAKIVSIKANSMPVPMLDTDGNPLAAIEPTVTFDGQLVIFQRFGSLAPNEVGAQYYSYNANAATSPAAGWSVPQRVTVMNQDPVLRSRGYPLALYPMRDAYGAPYTTNPFFGAYVWVSPDGSDLFVSAIVSDDGARRAATSVVGSGTKGMVRLLDGPPNINRFGMAPFARLFVSSPGRTPGQWSPLEFTQQHVLPLTDKLYTYPMFSSNSAKYFEASFEETLVGNYDLYLDMAEVVTQKATYDIHSVQDLSGNFHYGAMNAGARFPEEAFPDVCLNDGGCPMDDPMSDAGANLFSGKAVYFLSSGAITVQQTSATDAGLLAGAQNLTVSLAVLPLADLSSDPANDVRALANLPGTFNLILEKNRTISASVYAVADGGAQEYRSTFVGSQLPLGQWSHVAMTFAPATGELGIYENGRWLQSAVVAPPGAPLAPSTGPLVLGPNLGSVAAGAGDASGFTYALDQVGISRVVRTPAEIARQAGLVFPRLAPLPTTLASGLSAQAVRSPVLVSRALDPALVTLGQYLFFDPRLSPDNRVACATCHLASQSFSEPIPLHPSRLQEPGQPAHTPRNTPDLTYLATKELFFRDGRAASLVDQAATVLSNPVEMGTGLGSILPKLQQSPQYAQLFAAAYPDAGGITSYKVEAALQEFELSLVTSGAPNNGGAGGSPFDQFMAGNLSALTADQQLGKALFFGKARCAQCHAGTAFSDGIFHADVFVSPFNEDGVTDLGRQATSLGPDDAFKFLTPSLRNVSLTGPYFHNGSVATLTEVVNLYNAVDAGVDAGRAEEMLFPINLSATESAALVDFLGTLTAGPPALTAPAYTDPPTATPATQTYATGAAPFVAGSSLELDAVSFAVGSSGATLLDNAGTVLWSTGSAGAACGAGCTLTFQSDGNLVLQNGSGQTLWQSNTAGNAGDVLTVSSSPPYLTIGASGGTPIWSAYQSLVAAGALSLQVSGPSASGSAIADFGDGYFLQLVPSGDFQLIESGSMAQVWDSNTAGDCTAGPCEAAWQGDGNLVLYAEGKAYWASNTSGNPAAILESLAQAPYLEIVSGGRQLWP